MIRNSTRFVGWVRRKSELEPRYRDLGHPELFEPVQALVATCDQAACYGTVTTPHRFYSDWKTMWPTNEVEFAKAKGRATLPTSSVLGVTTRSPDARSVR